MPDPNPEPSTLSPLASFCLRFPCPRGSNICPAHPVTGFYCPKGSGLTWQPCPPGTYGQVPGLSSLTGCRACDGGKFCPGANATEAGGQCWEGFFCSRGSTRPNPEAGTEGTGTLRWILSLAPFPEPMTGRWGTEAGPSIRSLVKQRGG